MELLAMEKSAFGIVSRENPGNKGLVFWQRVFMHYSMKYLEKR